jgi:hypothetical protein
MNKIDTGDIVKHLPTDELWTVACVIDDKLSWCGYPEGTANLNDCVLVDSCPEDEKQEILEMLTDIKGHDHRKEYAINRLKRASQ